MTNTEAARRQLPASDPNSLPRNDTYRVRDAWIAAMTIPEMNANHELQRIHDSGTCYSSKCGMSHAAQDARAGHLVPRNA